MCPPNWCVRQAEKYPIGGKCAVGGDGMDMRVEMDQFPKGLDAGHHAGHDVRPLEHLPVDLDHAFPGGAGQFAKETAVVAAVDAEPFGDREHELAVGDGRADRIGDDVGRQERAFLVATGAQAPLAAGEG